MSNPALLAFAALAINLQAVNCPPPLVAFSTDVIQTVCQKQALPNHHALSCYFPGYHLIVLPDSCEGADNHFCNRLAYHEASRHVRQACLGEVFTDPEPVSVLQDEELAP